MLLRIYLAAYFLVVLAAVLALWNAGVLGRLPVAWVFPALVMSIGLGLLLAVLFRSHPPAGA